MRCQAIAKSTNEQCKSTVAGITVSHDDHTHRVCGTHKKATEFVSSTCPKGFDPNQLKLQGIKQQFTVYFCGMFPNWHKSQDGIVKFWVIESTNIQATNLDEVLASRVVEMNQDHLSLRYLLIKAEDGTKAIYCQVDEGEDGIKNGRWHWEHRSIKSQVVLVHSPNHCAKCLGTGEVTFGRVNYISKHGLNRRGCFECIGHGVMAHS
jgi:hypothetical protein